MKWTPKHPNAHPDMLGFLPGFLSEVDPRPAKEQITRRYISGWQNFEGFTMNENGDLLYPKYPNDPPTLLLYETKLRNETIRFYQHSWVAIIQEDGSFEVTQID